MTYEEAVAEKKRRAGAAAAPAALSYDDAVAEKKRREVADFQKQGPVSQFVTQLNDRVRTFGNGITFGGADYLDAGTNTVLDNIGNSFQAKAWGEDGATFEENLAESQLKSQVAEARLNSDKSWGEGNQGTALYYGGAAVGPGKVAKMAAPIVKPVAKALAPVAAVGGAYLAGGGDALNTYGGYALLRDAFARMRGGRR